MKKSLILLCFIFILFPVQASIDINSWGYQLQEINVEEITSSDYDMMIIDYSKDGSDEEAFTTSELQSMKGGNKILICYISIGEAEDYRYYFKNDWLDNPPEWLDEENSDWRGNYKVKYWDTVWQGIILGYVDKIIEAGFDGLYMDIIDAYEYFEEERIDSKADMVDFVEIIANHARQSNPNILIIPQNGEQIVEERYFNVIDGIAREEVYVLATNDKRDDKETKEIESYLDQYLEAGNFVLTVDYADDEELTNLAIENSRKKGYIPLVTAVDLDVLTVEAFFPIIIIPLTVIVIIRRKRLSYNLVGK